MIVICLPFFGARSGADWYDPVMRSLRTGACGPSVDGLS
jgi:hypothetical protein